MLLRDGDRLVPEQEHPWYYLNLVRKQVSVVREVFYGVTMGTVEDEKGQYWDWWFVGPMVGRFRRVRVVPAK